MNTMTEKELILIQLKQVFTQWQDLLASLDEEQITSPLTPSAWTVKDIVAHMWAWQQGSVARMQAALQDRQPAYPDWWLANGPNPVADLDRTNVWIYQANRERPWHNVYSLWRDQFQLYIVLTSRLAENDLLTPRRYTWMGVLAIADSCLISIEHHQEHLDDLKAWLSDHSSF
jgi:hypothetical protein